MPLGMLFIAVAVFLVEVSRTEEMICIKSNSDATSHCIYRGKPGIKGEKGDLGGVDEDSIASLKNELSSLREELKTLRTNQANLIAANLTAALLRGYMELGSGWIAPFNGYQYKATLEARSWNESRVDCQNRGGDLAQYGIQDTEKRITLNRVLSLNGAYWIGLSDRATEGTWLWLDGTRANSDDRSLWTHSRPTNSRHRNCAHVHFGLANHGLRAGEGLFFDDASCARLSVALCEKPVN